MRIKDIKDAAKALEGEEVNLYTFVFVVLFAIAAIGGPIFYWTNNPATLPPPVEQKPIALPSMEDVGQFSGEKTKSFTKGFIKGIFKND